MSGRLAASAASLRRGEFRRRRRGRPSRRPTARPESPPGGDEPFVADDGQPQPTARAGTEHRRRRTGHLQAGALSAATPSRTSVSRVVGVAPVLRTSPVARSTRAALVNVEPTSTQKALVGGGSWPGVGRRARLVVGLAEGLVEVGDEVGDILDADREPDQVRRDLKAVPRTELCVIRAGCLDERLDPAEGLPRVPSRVARRPRPPHPRRRAAGTRPSRRSGASGGPRRHGSGGSAGRGRAPGSPPGGAAGARRPPRRCRSAVPSAPRGFQATQDQPGVKRSATPPMAFWWKPIRSAASSAYAVVVPS